MVILRAIIHPESPALMALANVLDISGTEESEKKIRSEAQRRLNHHLAAYYSNRVAQLPPVYHLKQTVVVEPGRAWIKYCWSDWIP